MEFASVALNSLLPKLFQLLHGEYKLHKDVRKGIQFLHDELRTMHAALEKVGEVPTEQLDNLQRIWAQDVRDLSYDMEDIVDTFMVRGQGHEEHPPGQRSAIESIKKVLNIVNFVTKMKTRREVAKEIKGIKERLQEVADRRDRYTVNTTTQTNKTLVDPRIRALYTKATELVGIGDAKAEVITMLATEDDDCSKRIVSIAGFGGLGKTTLAKAVYDEIGGQFDCKAFVSVSRNLDAKKIFKDMLYELDKVKFKEIHSTMLEDKHLIDEVTEFIRNKRYLIVIDDVWDIKHWELIVLALENSMRRSRIIMTTRNVQVANKVGGCYMLKPLSPESSKELFYGRIPGSKEKWWRTKFLDVSEQIIKKCGGVPLAIVTTSSLLANKSENIKEWHAVRVSIGSGLENELDMYGMRQILLLSYYDLPSHLKTCLLYLSIFPEDYVIRKDRLIWRWVAEGFIQDQQAADLSFLEMGESYFNELVNRSLIQAAHEDVTGTPQACRVHDAVLDLILSLSMEESFITTVSGDGSLSLERSKQEVHRLSLHSYMTWPTMNMPKLRSLTIFKPASIFKSDDVEIGLTLMPSLSCSHLLRVLDLRDYELKDIASLGFLGSLSHLRYLGLSSSSCFEVDYRADWLPVEIGKLQFLQTLDISQTEIREVSSSIISGLRRLMCLRGGNGGGGFRWSATRLPNGLKDLTSLEVLESALVASERIAKELGYLIRLRVLEIRVGDVMHSNIGGGDNEENACTNALVESLGKLKKIESLCIINDFNTLCYDGSMEKEALVNLHTLRIDGAWAIPTWIEPASLPGLTHLNIWVLQERKADIQVLGTLPYLRHLRLQAMEKPLERCVVGPHAFPCLETCEIDIRGGLVPSILPRDAMPKLEDYKFRIEREQLLGGSSESTTVDDLALGHLRLLRSVTVMGLYIYEGDDEATKDKIMSAKEKLEYEAAVHPNHPLRLEITRWD